MRIVGGQFRGRAIASPVTEATRPTSDRVREAMFNILAHSIDGFTLEGAVVLDLFAGTGALGIEALSRGAKFCMFVETEAEARGIIRDNVEAFGLTGVTKIFRRDVTGLGQAGKYGGMTLVFADPPYGQSLGEKALASAAVGGWLAPGAVIVLEERRDADVRLPPGFIEIDRRAWGETQAIFATWTNQSTRSTVRGGAAAG
ncbi:MAG: 16S rRNA (guanine(966)-N(2))-methyltransferase RsmD [Hyphomicrobiaceae bacterium]|nr:16S rRNA (guanine(966)-N(2))-methyltransferase RsmD [Hyphomicrobiaceae bacterium]